MVPGGLDSGSAKNVQGLTPRLKISNLSPKTPNQPIYIIFPFVELGGGNSNICYFHPDPWRRFPFWRAAYFSNGWFNHQRLWVGLPPGFLVQDFQVHRGLVYLYMLTFMVNMAPCWVQEKAMNRRRLKGSKKKLGPQKNRGTNKNWGSFFLYRFFKHMIEAYRVFWFYLLFNLFRYLNLNLFGWDLLYIGFTPPKFNSSPLKNGGTGRWSGFLSGPLVTFQG